MGGGTLIEPDNEGLTGIHRWSLNFVSSKDGKKDMIRIGIEINYDDTMDIKTQVEYMICLAARDHDLNPNYPVVIADHNNRVRGVCLNKKADLKSKVMGLSIIADLFSNQNEKDDDTPAGVNTGPKK